MKNEDVYKKEINDLISRRGNTKFHITGIRHCDFKDKADDFIRDAAQKMQNVILMPEEANQYDQASVVCRSGNRKIGYVSVYDLEKYQILTGKEDSDHLTGHFFFGNTGDHLLDLSVAGIVTLDDIRDYRKEVDRQKKEQYSSWKHDAIKRFLVHGRHQEDAKACIIQMKEFVIGLYGGYGSTAQEELSPKLEQYKESSQYDISLEGQRDRWDILRYLDYLYDRWHQPGTIVDEDFEDILTDISSQIGGELGRNVSYTAYIERLTELVTKELPSSETAQYYLRALPSEAFEDIRQQVENFPHHLYHLFHTNPEEFVRTIYYARIPRKYLDPFLSGIALVEAYDKKPKRWQVPDEKTMKLRNLGEMLEEWYEDYCERIVHYPTNRQLNALRNMRKQVLANADWAEGSPRMGDNADDIRYLIFSTPKENYKPRLKDFGGNFIRNAYGQKREIAWEEYVPEKIAHEMPLAEFAYLFFCSALNYEIERLEDVMLYDEPYEGGISDVNDFEQHEQQQTTDDETPLPIPIALNTKRAQCYFHKAIEKGYMKVENGFFSWIGVGLKGKKSQLAYFCGLVFEYKNSINGNVGREFPENELNVLFGEKRLYSLLVQVYNAQKPQKWRVLIDELFE